MELPDIDPRIEWAETLSSNVYTDPSILPREQKLIFNRTWQLAGRLDQLIGPGSYFTTRVVDEPVVIIRDHNSVIRGYRNVCRHRAGPVARGAGECRNFQCAYHGWTYSLEGDLIGVPDFEGVEGFDKESMGLIPVCIEIWEQFIFVKIDTSTKDLKLDDYFGEVKDFTKETGISNMRFGHRRDYEIECNWKVYIDNYVEGYHVPIVHPGLMRELDFQRYRTITYRLSSQQDAPIKTGSEAGRTYKSGAGGSEALYFWVFPNLMLNIYPDNISTNLILPINHDRTLTIFEWFFHDPDSKKGKERIEEVVGMSHEVQLEDISICEDVQRGLKSSAYKRGRYSVKRETGVHQFHTLWLDFMRE